MKIGGLYNVIGQPDPLIYTGRNLGGNGHWHQFRRIGDLRKVWCEVLDEDLYMIEETPCSCRDGECESKATGCRMAGGEGVE